MVNWVEWLDSVSMEQVGLVWSTNGVQDSFGYLLFPMNYKTYVIYHSRRNDLYTLMINYLFKEMY